MSVPFEICASQINPFNHPLVFISLRMHLFIFQVSFSAMYQIYLSIYFPSLYLSVYPPRMQLSIGRFLFCNVSNLLISLFIYLYIFLFSRICSFLFEAPSLAMYQIFLSICLSIFSFFRLSVPYFMFYLLVYSYLYYVSRSHRNTQSLFLSVVLPHAHI